MNTSGFSNTASLKAAKNYTGAFPLLDLTQGLPAFGPPPELIEYLQDEITKPGSFRYADRAGIEALRLEFANHMNLFHGSKLSLNNVLITQGCNQAFFLATSCMVNSGDRVLVHRPFYFDFVNWLEVLEAKVEYIEQNLGGSLLSQVEHKTSVKDSVSALVLVSPCNPTGRVLTESEFEKAFSYCKEIGAILIVDETYRAFSGMPLNYHRLLELDPELEQCILLYSFSKEFALSGMRVGAMVANQNTIMEASKLLNCTSVCAPTISQKAALFAIQNCTGWFSDKTLEIYQKLETFENLLKQDPGNLSSTSAGALFSWVKHPYSQLTDVAAAKKLLQQTGISTLPGSIFCGQESGHLRFSVGSATSDQLDTLPERFREIFAYE